MRQNRSHIRRESAADKARKAQKKLDLVQYTIEDDDIKFLSGPYYGKTVREIWFSGPEERDYVVSHLWNLHDEKVMKIIRELTCK